MREFDRRTGVKHLRVRGMMAVCFAAVMKAIGINIFRASRYRKRQTGLFVTYCGVLLAFLTVCSLMKDPIHATITRIRRGFCILSAD